MNPAQDFLPASLAGWVGLAVQSIAVISVVLAIVLRNVRAPLELADKELRAAAEAKAQEHGARIGRVESSCERNTTLVEKVDRDTERLHIQFVSMSEGMGRLDAHLKTLTQRWESYHEERLKESKAIGERLARIETRLSLPPPPNGHA